MGDAEQTGQAAVIRRKVAAATPPAAEGSPGADRGWRLALARAARDILKLGLEVRWLTLDRLSLAELLELPQDHSLLAVLEGPGEGLGLMALSPAVLSAMVEVQTLGRVLETPVVTRKPTRTDAAMIAPAIDAALSGLETALADEADLTWAGGFRYASFLDDPRPLGLLLEDGGFRVLRAEVTLADGARTGAVLLALPAEGRGPRPARATPAVADPGPAFARALAEQVADAGCVLDAVLTRLSVPLAQLVALAEGDVLSLPAAALDRIGFEGVDAQRVTEGRLGQNRGMRAVRLCPPAAAAEPAPPALRAVG